MNKSSGGLTFWFALGRPIWRPKIEAGWKLGIRVAFLWFSFAILFHDIEQVLSNLKNALISHGEKI